MSQNIFLENQTKKMGNNKIAPSFIYLFCVPVLFFFQNAKNMQFGRED